MVLLQTEVVGTANEITVSEAGGTLTLSLPETINANISGNAATATTALTANYADSAGAAGRLANTPESGNSVIIAINSADSSIYPSALDPMVLLQTEVVGTANEITVSEAGGTLTLSLPETINANISGNAATATTALTVHYADTAGVANTLANTFAAGASAIAALSTNGDTLTNSTFGTANNVTGIVAASNGGTSTSTYAKGDMLYADTINSLAKLPIGTENQVLYVTGGKPTWGSVPAAGAAPYAVYSGVLDVTSDPFLVPDSVVNGSTVVFITESISGDPVLTLSDGNTPGQLLILVNHNDLTHVHLHDAGNINIQNPDFHFHQHGDNITLLWCGSMWVEVSRTNQD
jgi:hypothetical protein